MIVVSSKVLITDGEKDIKVLQALANNTRMQMLSLLTHTSLNVTELAEAIGLPASTTAFHLKQLETAGLVSVQFIPGTRGQQKLLTRNFDEVRFRLPGVAIESKGNTTEISMPVGNYTAISAVPTCGLASDSKYIGMVDDIRSFYETEHVFAQILWFRRGFVEYNFPNKGPDGAIADEIQISMEICSEAPEYDLDWPSDITLSINGVEVGLWTSPADFGGVRGKLTPNWWPLEQTQYGVLKIWRVNETGSYLDGIRLSGTTIGELRLDQSSHVCVRLEVKADAHNVGGINIFGKRFGNYRQDIVMRTHYAFPSAK